MGKFDSVLDRIQKSASDRDVGSAKEKCPLRRKPAIYVAVVRGDTGDPVASMEVDISKPTKNTSKTNPNGEAKVDPAKEGEHRIKVILTKEQEKIFTPPPDQTATTSRGKTAIHIFVLEPMPKLVVEAMDLDIKKPLNAVRITAGALPLMETANGKADFGGVQAGRYRITAEVPKPLESKVEVFYKGALLRGFEPGHPVEWDAELPAGETKVFQVRVSRIRWVEFILVEDGTDKPIEGAKITAKLPGGGISTVKTDKLGNARVTFAQDGQVEIEKIEMSEMGQLVEVTTR